jgi:hypothetical protein
VNRGATGRTQQCTKDEARARLRDAEAQLVLAELADASSPAEERKAAASCAVIAGIAASDAACCQALGQRSRSQDHRDAVAVVRQVSPGGPDAAKQLSRLMNLKDQAQYGFETMSGQKLTSSVRQARALVEFAREVLAR